MSKVLPVCAAILFLIAVLSFSRFAAAATSEPAGAVPSQVQPAAKPPVKPPAQPQSQPPAASPAAPAPTVKALPLVRKTSAAQQKPVLANVDLRPDVVGAIQTEPPLSNNQTYHSYNNMGKPLKVTAVVENGGLTKADKVAIEVLILRIPTPQSPVFGQSSWTYHYTADLGPGETVSYPFDVLFPPSAQAQFIVKSTFAGDEKSKTNNGSLLYVKF